MLTLQLSTAEIATLKYEMYHYPDPLVQKRLHSVYLKSTQPSIGCVKIGEYVGLNRKTVSESIHAYKSGGIKSLFFNNYGTNFSILETQHNPIIKDLTDNPVATLAEAKSRIQALTGIERSIGRIGVFLKKHDFEHRLIGHIPAKVDVEKQEKFLTNTLEPAIKKAQNGEIYLLFGDTAHFVRGAFLCCLWCITRLFIKSPSGRERINVIGAVDAITKKLYFQYNTTFVNAVEFCKFLSYLKEQLADKPISIVLDNARYQHCNLVKEFAQSLEINIIFLPAYSPNLNIIERVWKFVKRKALYGKFYDNFSLFQKAILDTMNQINSTYQKEMTTLLNLKFQTFENVQIYAG
jgi:transposase